MSRRFTLWLCCAGWLFLIAGCTGDTMDPHHAAAERIFVDGRFSDWAKVTPLHVDPADDVATDSIDLGRLWVGHDRRFLFLRIDVGTEINIQSGNELTLYLDTDHDAATGRAVHGIGAELTWTFGERTGQFMRGLDTTAITHADVGLVTSPTVSSTTFVSHGFIDDLRGRPRPPRPPRWNHGALRRRHAAHCPR